MKLLAIDTATEACSAALAIDGRVLHAYRVAPREHSRLILPMIEGLLNEAGLQRSELEAVAFGRGPGSFMGVRIAAGVAQGIAYAHDLPVAAVSTLAAMAQRAYEEQGLQRVCCAIDARMDEVYWGAYRLDAEGYMRLAGEESVTAPDRVAPAPGEGWAGAGTGWAAYRDALTSATRTFVSGPVLHEWLPSAQAVAVLGADAYRRGQTVPAEKAVPVYLRNRVASKPGSRPGA